jgi:large subunit ribosomal protein L10
MAKAEKVEKVTALKERIEGSQALILANYRGLTVVDTRELRTSLRDADAAFAVVKNTLMKRAVDDAGIGSLDAMLEGPTAVAFVHGDAVGVAKRLSEAQRRFPALEIKGGFMEGKVLSADEARGLASLESREVMLSKFAGLAKTEMSRAASMFQALQRRFLGVLDAYRDKVPGDGEAAAASDASDALEAPPDASVMTAGHETAGDEAPTEAIADAPMGAADEADEASDSKQSEARSGAAVAEDATPEAESSDASESET